MDNQNQQNKEMDNQQESGSLSAQNLSQQGSAGPTNPIVNPQQVTTKGSGTKTALIIVIVSLAILLIISGLIVTYFFVVKKDNGVTTNQASMSQDSNSSCLVASDFDNLYSASTGAQRPSSIDWSNPVTQYSANVHFKPGSTAFSDSILDAEAFIPATDFYKENSSKQFTIHLRGSVATNKPSDKTLAINRADKMKDILIENGVPAERIVIDEPNQLSSSGGSLDNAADQSIARNVVLKIDPTCS